MSPVAHVMHPASPLLRGMHMDPLGWNVNLLEATGQIHDLCEAAGREDGPV